MRRLNNEQRRRELVRKAAKRRGFGLGTLKLLSSDDVHAYTLTNRFGNRFEFQDLGDVVNELRLHEVIT